MRDVTLPKIDLSRLTAAERLQLLEQIWETFCEDPESLPVSDPQRQELDRRVAEIDAGTMPSRPWEEVHEEIRRDLELRSRR